MKTTKEILIAAREKIEKPESWCQNSLRDGDKMCAVGALLDTAGKTHLLSAAFAMLAYSMDTSSVGDFNDSHTHEEVLAKFDEAIAAA